MNEKDREHLKKISSYINDVFEFTNGYTFSTFIDDKKTMTACAMAFGR